MRRKRNPLAFWLAVIATACNILWPLLAQARVRAATVPVPVCTIEGVTHYLELPTGKAPLPGSGEHKHCSVCTVTAPPAAAHASPVFVRQPDEAQVVVAPDLLPAVSLQYSPALSRAPPPLSSV